MPGGLCDGNDTFVESKLDKALTIIWICLPQDFVMDFRVQVHRKAAQEMWIGLFRPRPCESTSKHPGLHRQRAGVMSVEESQGLRWGQARIKETRARTPEDAKG